eukprot:7378863-Prymnesium_polylepis.1
MLPQNRPGACFELKPHENPGTSYRPCRPMYEKPYHGTIRGRNKWVLGRDRRPKSAMVEAPQSHVALEYRLTAHHRP